MKTRDYVVRTSCAGRKTLTSKQSKALKKITDTFMHPVKMMWMADKGFCLAIGILDEDKFLREVKRLGIIVDKED